MCRFILLALVLILGGVYASGAQGFSAAPPKASMPLGYSVWWLVIAAATRIVSVRARERRRRTDAPNKQPAGQQLRQNELKWGRKLMDAGFTVVPTVVLDRQAALGLDALDVNIVLHLACRWWFADNPPHPSKRTIARAIGVDPSTVRRRITRMVKDGLLEREPRFGADHRQEPNRYHLRKLIEHALPFAEEEIASRAKARKEREDRNTRKRPKLRVLDSAKGRSR